MPGSLVTHREPLMFYLFCLVLVAPLSVSISGPSEAKVGDLVTVSSQHDGIFSEWILPDSFEGIASGDKLSFGAATEGSFVIYRAVSSEEGLKIARHDIQILPAKMELETPSSFITIYAPSDSTSATDWVNQYSAALTNAGWGVRRVATQRNLLVIQVTIKSYSKRFVGPINYDDISRCVDEASVPPPPTIQLELSEKN